MHFLLRRPGLLVAFLSVPLLAQGVTAKPEVYPGARLDEAETAALAESGRGPLVDRTDSNFDVVVNSYRYKRKQGVHIVEEDLGARFDRIARLVEREPMPPALAADPFVVRFHAFAIGDGPDRRFTGERAARAWRNLGRRFAGRLQRIGEGERVTIIRPWVSYRTFTIVDDTIILLQRSSAASS